jgi:hypothetical protein
MVHKFWLVDFTLVKIPLYCHLPEEGEHLAQPVGKIMYIGNF